MHDSQKMLIFKFDFTIKAEKKQNDEVEILQLKKKYQMATKIYEIEESQESDSSGEVMISRNSNKQP